MSERKFTRLKQSLSQTTGTAAKARETVSRELRQSTLSPGMDSLLSAIDNDYERSLREWNADLKQKLRDVCRSQESSTTLQTLNDDSNPSASTINTATMTKSSRKSNNKCSTSAKDNSPTSSNSDTVDKIITNDKAPSEDTNSDSSVITAERLDLDLITQFATPEDDIQCLSEMCDAQRRFDFARFYPSVNKHRPSSPFAQECIQHFTGQRHHIRWKLMEQYFGTVFDTAPMLHNYQFDSFPSPTNTNPTSSSTTFLQSRSISANDSSPHSTNLNSANQGSNSMNPMNSISGFSSARSASPLHGLKSHLFECDQANIHESALTPLGFRISTQNRLIREGNASVISLENELSGKLMSNSGNDSSLFRSPSSNSSSGSSSVRSASSSNTSGWLTLSKDEKSCFLTFYDSPRRDKIRWHIEVNRKVQKLAEPPNQCDSAGNIKDDLTKSCFRLTKHLIFTDKRYIDDWLRDINNNIGEEFKPEAELERIMMGDNRQISERLRSSKLINQINLFASFANDLVARPGSFTRLKNSIHRIGFNGYLRESSPEYFQFQFNIRNFELHSSSNEKHKASSLSLQSTVSTGSGNSSNNSTSSNVGETFFLRVALFDAKLGKISEDFRYTISGDLKNLRGEKMADMSRGFRQDILCQASKAIFSVDLSQSLPADLFLVIRVEKSFHRLSGFVCQQNIPSNSNNNYSQNNSLILQHSEPWAWSVRPVFQDSTSGFSNNSSNNSSNPGSQQVHNQLPQLECSSNFGVFFKMDQNRLSDDFIVQCLRNQQSQQSSSNKSQTMLNARLEVELTDLQQQPIKSHYQPTLQQQQQQNLQLPSTSGSKSALHLKHRSSESLLDQQNSQQNPPVLQLPEFLLNPSLFVHSQTVLKTFQPILEIQPLRLLSLPHREFYNLLYIYPQSLKFDSQRVFSKARNLCVTIEIRDSDEPEKETTKSLPLIFGRPHDPEMFVTSATTSLTKHNVTPDFYEEIKVALPLQFSEKLHALFTFSHLSCKKECTYSVVGYAWLRLSPDSPKRTRMDNPIHSSGQLLHVFTSLPSGYLACQTLGLGKGLNLPDIKTVGKELFRVNTILISSVISRDVDLQATISAMIKITRSNRDDSKEISTIISLERNLPKLLRHLMDCDTVELIHFLPMILNQLLKLLVFAASQELITEAFKTILLVVEKFTQLERVKLLNSFIEEIFKTSEFCGVYVHDQLVVLLNKIFTDYSQNVGNTSSSSFGSGAFDELKLLLNSLWFVLRIMTKSMIQYLIQTGRALLPREDRFDAEFVGNIKQFIEVVSSLIGTFSRAAEASAANQSIAHFMTRLCSFFDRSIIFNLFHHHISILSSRDIIIQELKLAAIAILLSHEHFAILSNPLLDCEAETLKNGSVFANCFSLTPEYCRKHLPVYLALSEFKLAYSLGSSGGSSQGSNTTSNKHVRQICLIMLRNQLAKHLLDERWCSLPSKVFGIQSPTTSGSKEESNKNDKSNSNNNSGSNNTDNEELRERYRERLLVLYLPMVQIILDNTSRMIDSTIASKNGQYWSFGLLNMMLTAGQANGTGNNSNSTSPFSTVNEVPGLIQADNNNTNTAMALSNTLFALTRSTSEIAGNNSLTSTGSSTIHSLSSVSSFGSLSSALSTMTLTNVGTQGHARTNSMATLSQVTSSGQNSGRSDKFSADEVRDIFVCLLTVVQVLNIDRMNELGTKSLKDLFLCLECAANVFEYKPQSKLSHHQNGSHHSHHHHGSHHTSHHHSSHHHSSLSSHSSHNQQSNRSKTLPNFIEGSGDFFTQVSGTMNSGTLNSPPIQMSGGSGSSPNELMNNHILQQNLSIQTALITLRTVHLYLDNDLKPIDTAIIAQILSIYLTLMSLPQSQTVLIHVFNSIRYFVQKFALLLFNSDAFLSPIIAKVVKYCNSSLTLIRQGATDLLYCLLSTNLKRTRFETIVCVSRLASSDQHGLLYLQSSLNRIELLSSVDGKDLKNANQTPEIGHEDCEEVSILSIVIRIREILKATKQIREESSDPYLGSELRLQLANSYSKTSRSLLRTWMENLAEMHYQRQDWAEAAMCLCQVIAIMIGQLGSKGIEIADSMSNLTKISENISSRENFKQESDWLELEESHVSIEILENFIKKTVEWFEKAELFELAPNVLKVLIAWYEREYEHKKLAELYTKIAKVHSKVQEINESGKRLFDTFFRVAFYQANQFGGHRTEYIYKVAKVVSLAEMTGRMQALHPGAIFLSSDPESLMDVPALLKSHNSADSHSKSQDLKSSDSLNVSKKTGIVITHVFPFVEGAKNAFEKSVGVSQFVYEQRLTGKIATSVSEQFKKRVILTVPNAFPYFLKRIPISNRREMILSPIEVAIDEMQDRVRQLDHVIGTKDVKHLQLILQGSVNVVVNAGPIAYANAFLRKPMSTDNSGEEIRKDNNQTSNDTSNSTNNDEVDSGTGSFGAEFTESQKHLKFLFEHFLDLCESALKLNEKLIKPNQIEYHQNLKSNFDKLKDELDFLHERHTSIQIFDVISGANFG